LFLGGGSMKKISFLITLIIMPFLILSCSQKLPVQQAGFGLVAVPFHVINRTDFTFIYTYELRSSTDEKFCIMIKPGINNNDVSLSNLIKEGEYYVDKMVTKVVTDYYVMSKASKHEVDLEEPFTIYVNSGEIVLFPILVEVEQYLKNESIMVQGKNIEVNDELEKFYRDRIMKMENSNMWKVTAFQ
jgi:hypothetical protein